MNGVRMRAAPAAATGMLALALGSAATAATTETVLDRTVLPVQLPPRPVITEPDARNVKAPPLIEVRAPAGAPNVVIILIDDLGFGAPVTFGGPVTMPTLAEMLRLNGYSTAAFGKWHETAAWEASISGPFDRWPTRQGFDKFYGFIGGETNQWAPYLHDGVAQVELPDDMNYHFMADMTDKAVAWLKYQKALTPDRPALIYFAPGATHAPHHVPKERIE